MSHVRFFVGGREEIDGWSIVQPEGNAVGLLVGVDFADLGDWVDLAEN
ncbi:MAG: hypothetical protein ACYTEX_24115 [Planctomycetota bacterium]